MEKVNIRGIDILTVRTEKDLVDFLLNEREIKTGKLIAVNAEKVIISEKQPEMGALLKQAEYNYADGISLVLSIRKKYPQYCDLERIAGADLWVALMRRAGELGCPVFLIGGQAETLRDTKAKLTRWNVNIVGVQDGYFEAARENEIIARVKQSGARFITVAMGSPKQEIFMLKMQRQYPDALYMGVGGTYDVFTNRVKRAPESWRNMNLEWLYRLLRQPTRWRRQLNLLRYAYYYLTNKL